MSVVMVALGGALGSVARFAIWKAVTHKAKIRLLLGTFIANISGTILLGIVMALPLAPSEYALLAEGFLGAYTTFSTFMFEGLNLIENNEKMNAFLYILISVVLGIIGFWAGMQMTKYFL